MVVTAAAAVVVVVNGADEEGDTVSIGVMIGEEAEEAGKVIVLGEYVVHSFDRCSGRDRCLSDAAVRSSIKALMEIGFSS